METAGADANQRASNWSRRNPPGSRHSPAPSSALCTQVLPRRWLEHLLIMFEGGGMCPHPYQRVRSTRPGPRVSLTHISTRQTHSSCPHWTGQSEWTPVHGGSSGARIRRAGQNRTLVHSFNTQLSISQVPGTGVAPGGQQGTPGSCCFLTRCWVPNRRTELTNVGEARGGSCSGTLNVSEDLQTWRS